MALVPPNLDDRRFNDLVAEALNRIQQTCPEWTDLSSGDPGVTLLEVFAYLTDILLYRVNRIPEKAYVEFLRIIGVQLEPPSAASVNLEFSINLEKDTDIEIPRGTRVAAQLSSGANEPIVFVTTQNGVITAGEKSATISALHCEVIDAEEVGVGTGNPGQTITVGRPPIIAPSGDGMDLIVGVEASGEELVESTPAIQYGDKAYRIWREVENFSNVEQDKHIYVADRLSGTIFFAPALHMKEKARDTMTALADVPELNREIRVWYRRGGGYGGNVAANTLTVIKGQLTGVQVTNPQPATGGGNAETLENALIRGPQQLHSLHRAVTARDFELLAKRSSRAVNRAYAYTKSMRWSYAQEGTVEVLIVPNVQVEAGPVTVSMLHEQQSDIIIKQVKNELDVRKPLGTHCEVNWAKYKSVNVQSRIKVLREEDRQAVEERVLQRLWQTINPLEDIARDTNWAFGRQLTQWDIYKIISEEPAVNSVDYVRLEIDQVPGDDIHAVCADEYQPDTWYAGSGGLLFRSSNNGDGWELLREFPNEQIIKIKSFPKEASAQKRAGLLAVATRQSDSGISSIYVSHDCGESWDAPLRLTFSLNDVAWVDRDNNPVLLLATETGLFELAPKKGADPKKIPVKNEIPDLGFYAVAVSSDIWSGTAIAVAARPKEGVFLSIQAGKPNTFKAIGLNEELIRVLSFHRYGAYRYLWAGTHVPGAANGNGCFRWWITSTGEAPEGWKHYLDGWGKSGNCNAIAFQGDAAYAASDRSGVLRLDLTEQQPSWNAPSVNCGLPLQTKAELGRLLPVDTVAVKNACLMAGGNKGVYRSGDAGVNYANASAKVFEDKVSLPNNWLFCSGEHNIQVVSVDETS